METPSHRLTHTHKFKKAERRKLKLTISTTASRLVRLRDLCSGEGFGNLLERVDREMGVTADMIEDWSLIIKKSLNKNGRTFQRREEQKRENLTRLHEWMLGVHLSSPSLTLLHWQATRLLCPPRTVSPSDEQVLDSDIIDDKLPRHDTEEWQRMVLKNWLLDPSATSPEDHVASSLINGPSTDNTIKPDGGADHDSYYSSTVLHEHSDSYSDEPWIRIVKLRTLDYGELNLMALLINEPATENTAQPDEAALKALQAYREKPEIWPKGFE